MHAEHASRPGDCRSSATTRPPDKRQPRGSVRYAVAWRGADGVTVRGSATIHEDTLELQAPGGTGGAATTVRVELDRVERMRIGRIERDRVRGERSLVLELAGGETLTIAPVGAPAAVFELTDLIAERVERSRGRDAP